MSKKEITRFLFDINKILCKSSKEPHHMNKMSWYLSVKKLSSILNIIHESITFFSLLSFTVQIDNHDISTSA